MKLGCNTVVFASVNLETALQHVMAAGYSYVELAVIGGMCEHVSPDAGPKLVKAVRTMLDDLGLTATAIEAASTDRDRLERVFGLATTLGIPIVNIGSGGMSGDEESTKASIAHLAGLAHLAGQHGIRLAVKPHVGRAIFNGATAMRLMSEVQVPALGLNFDPSHLYRAGEVPAEVARWWKQSIVSSHFRDCASPEQKVGPPETQIPGRGALDMVGTLRALLEVGYEGPLNLEIIGASEYTLAKAMGVAAESRGYLYRCLQELT